MGKTSTSAQSSQPWEAAAPYLKGNMAAAAKLFGMGELGKDPFNDQYWASKPTNPAAWQGTAPGALTDYWDVTGATPRGQSFYQGDGSTNAGAVPPPAYGELEDPDAVPNTPQGVTASAISGTGKYRHEPPPEAQDTGEPYIPTRDRELPPEQLRAGLVANAPRYFPGDLVQDFSSQQVAGLDKGTRRAKEGSPLVRGAQQGLLGTIQGQYLTPESNPYLEETFNKAAGAVSGRVGSEMAKLGRLGGGAHTDVLAQNLGNLATDIYGQNYERERGRQMQAMGLAPTLAAEDYKDVQMLMDLGGLSQEQAQKEVLAQKERYDYYQTLPFRQLADLTTMMNPNAGFGGTSMGQQTASGLTGLLGITGAMKNLFG